MATIATTSTVSARIAALLAAAVGLLCIGNGLHMLGAPRAWFWSVPGVSLTGGYNAHFIRDIGMIYILTGAAMFVGLARPASRFHLWGAAAAWLCAHAAFHLWEVAVGICGPETIPQNFLGVTLPGLVAAGLTFRSMRHPA